MFKTLCSDENIVIYFFANMFKLPGVAIQIFKAVVCIATRAIQPHNHQPLFVALFGAFCFEGATCPGLYGHSSATLPKDTHLGLINLGRMVSEYLRCHSLSNIFITASVLFVFSLLL